MATAPDPEPKRSSRLLTITPALAQEYIDSIKPGLVRRLVWGWVDHLAELMTNGRWDPSNDALCFSPEKNMLNGNHRMHAVVKSGVTIHNNLVLYNVPESAFSAMDGGRRRVAADLLSINGENDAVWLASALRVLSTYNEAAGCFRLGRHHSNTEILDLYRRCSGMRDSTDTIVSLNKHKFLRMGVAVTLHYLFWQIGGTKAAADDFFDRLFSGDNLSKKSVIWLLRQRLEANLGARAKLPNDYLTALTIKAWNFHAEGRQVSLLTYQQGKEQHEEFPRVYGDGKLPKPLPITAQAK